MPELPEVETIRRQLESRVAGRKIVKAAANCDSLVFRSCHAAGNLNRLLAGRKIQSLKRRGKYLLFGLDRGLTLVIHLGMSGNLLVREKSAPRDQHCHLEISFSDFKLTLRDPRMFGRVALARDGDFSCLTGLASLGPEPLSMEFNPRWLAEKFRGRKAPVKSLLLDQRIAPGIGNIYSDEACYLARISPLRRAGGLKPEEIKRLAAAVKRVLKEAIEKIGCTFRDYRTSQGIPGNYQPRAYGREGERCRRCGSSIRRKQIAGRSCFFCPGCQN